MGQISGSCGSGEKICSAYFFVFPWFVYLYKAELEGQVLLHFLCEPHELELREEELDTAYQEVHRVDVHEGVLLHEPVLNLKSK